MAMKGRLAKFQVSPDGTTWTDCGEVRECSASIAGNNIDVSKFSDAFIARIQGLKDCSWSVTAWLKPTDTNGQIVVRDALLNDDEIHVKFLVDGTAAGFTQQVVVGSFESSAAVDGAVELSMGFEGNGAVTAS